MQSTRHDSTGAALHASAGVPGQVVDVVVLTAEARLLATLHEASGPEHAIWHASSADAAVDLLVGGRCGVLIADLATLRGDASLLTQLQAQFPELVLLATGRREEEHTVAALVASGLIYRFLHKPVSPARAGLFLSTATRRYSELCNVAMPLSAPEVTFSLRNRWLGLAGVVAAFGAALAVTVALRESGDVRPPSPAATQADSATADAHQVADLLGHAQMAYAADRLSEPRGNNALQYFRAALTLDPRSADAQAGIDRVLGTLEARVVQALEARNTARGAVALTALQRAAPDHPRLDLLRNQLLAISRARPDSPVAAPVAQSATPARIAPPEAPVEATPNIDTARARIAAGALMQPEEDNALVHLRRARDADEGESALQIVATDAGLKALAFAEAALAAGDAAEGKRWLTSAQSIDQEFELALPGIDEVAEQLSSLPARRAEVDQDLQAAIRFRERGHLIEPAGENAYERVMSLRERGVNSDALRAEQQRLASDMLERTRTALAAGNADEAQSYLSRANTLVPGMSAARSLEQQLAVVRDASDFSKNVVPAQSLTQTRNVPARYPQATLRNGVEGYVDLKFTVAVDGSTQDLVVTAAQPANVFDRAAIEAVAQWRFEPVVKNGSPAPQRAAVRVRFEMK